MDMNKYDAVAYLTRCADDNGNHWYQGRVWDNPDTCPICRGGDDAGHLAAPCSRYGRTSAECASVAYEYARRVVGDTSPGWLDAVMSRVVNDADGIDTELRDYAIGVSGADIDDMVRGYLECQLWAQWDYDHPSCDCHADNPVDACQNYTLDENYGIDDISPEYVDALRDEIAGIVESHPLAVRMFLTATARANAKHGVSHSDRWTNPRAYSAQFGHDYYLTREGHGAGFWDRGLGALGDYLADIAKGMGSADYLSDNGEGVLVP